MRLLELNQNLCPCVCFSEREEETCVAITPNRIIFKLIFSVSTGSFLSVSFSPFSVQGPRSQKETVRLLMPPLCLCGKTFGIVQPCCFSQWLHHFPPLTYCKFYRIKKARSLLRPGFFNQVVLCTPVVKTRSYFHIITKMFSCGHCTSCNAHAAIIFEWC